MTQFLIESLTVILFVLAFYHLPHFAQLSPLHSRLRDALVALLAGVYLSVSRRFGPPRPAEAG